MANGQSTGAALGEALARSSENLMTFYIRNEQLRLQQQEAADMKQYRNKMGALNIFSTFAPFADPGKTMGQQAFLMEPARVVLGEEGAADFAQVAIPGTESSILQQARNAQLREMAENDPKQFNQLVRAYGEKTELGKPLEQWTQEETTALFRNAGLDMLREAWNEPENAQDASFMLQNIAREELGLPQQFEGILPNGRRVVFNSRDQANFLQTLNQFQWNQTVVNDQRITDMARSFVNFLTPEGESDAIPLEEARALISARQQGPGAMRELLAQRPDLALPAAHLNNSLAIQNRQMEYMILNATAPVDPETGTRDVQSAMPYVTMWNVFQSVRPDLDEATASRAYKILGDMVNQKAGSTVFPLMNPNGFFPTISGMLGGDAGAVEFNTEPFAGAPVTMQDQQRAALQVYSEGGNVRPSQLQEMGIPLEQIRSAHDRRVQNTGRRTPRPGSAEERSELFRAPEEGNE